MCSDSGVTYVSPCLAGCRSSTGRGKNIVGLQTFKGIEYVFDNASRGNSDEGITVLGVIWLCFLLICPTGLWQLQLRARVLPSKQQPLSEAGPVSSDQGVQPEFHLVHGHICPQLLYRLSGGHTRIHGHHTVGKIMKWRFTSDSRWQTHTLGQK